MTRAEARSTEIASLLGRLAELLAEPVEQEAKPERRPLPPRMLLTAEETAQALGIGRTSVYRLVRDGELQSVQVGRLRRIPMSAVQEYAGRLVSTNPTSSHVA